jgi:hypothetical protein
MLDHVIAEVKKCHLFEEKDTICNRAIPRRHIRERGGFAHEDKTGVYESASGGRDLGHHGRLRPLERA